MPKYDFIPTEEESGASRRPPSERPIIVLFYVFQAAFFLISSAILLAGYSRVNEAPCSCEPHVPAIYSPAQDAVKYKEDQFQGYLNLKSVYKGTPRKELDDAWDALSLGSILPGPTLSISEDELYLIGKGALANVTVQIPEALGGGYFATLEVFHNLHCLNLVRMATYMDHYEKEHAFGDHWLRDHIDHCIDMIRQRLTCTADIGLVTAVWVDGYTEPYPDFNTRHQCRDFDRIREWALDRALNVSMEEIVAARGEASLIEPPR